MNCEEIAVTLKETLFWERDPVWVRDARQHAEACSTCKGLLELQRIEECLTQLSVVDPSPAFLDAVMNRALRQKPVAVPASRWFCWETFRFSMVFVGALLLVMAYMVPTADSWQSVFEHWIRPIFTVRLNAAPLVNPFHMEVIWHRFDQYPSWAIAIATVASLLIVLGLARPEGESSESDVG